jgi:hypothetical protein
VAVGAEVVTDAVPAPGALLFAAAQDVHDGDIQCEDAEAWRTPPGGVLGGVVVDLVAA